MLKHWPLLFISLLGKLFCGATLLPPLHCASQTYMCGADKSLAASRAEEDPAEALV